MTRFSIRFGCYLVLALVTAETTQIQAADSLSRRSTRLATKSMLNEALLQTRGGWFRRKNKDDNNSTEPTLGDLDSTLKEVPLKTPLDQAAELRQQGKERHDDGNFTQAAQLFHQAANLLEEFLKNNKDDEDGNLQQDWSTCRLHESLCCLKAEDYEGCIQASSSLLDGEEAPPAMIRARAYHRRAKAKAALEDMEGAVIDARSAAFLGDRKAVAYYGSLLRHTGNGEAPLLPTSDTSDLFESLLSKSFLKSDGGGGGGMEDMLTSSLLGSLGGGFPGFSSPDGAATGSLAKSVLASLSKKLEDEETQDGICRYLQSANAVQVQTVLNVAGIDLPSPYVAKLVDIAHGITPKTIRRTLKLTKMGVWGFKLIRKIAAVVSKYRHLFFLAFLLQWTRSAVMRPIPVPKVKGARKAPKIAATPTPPNQTPNMHTQPQQQATGGGGGGKKPLTPGLLNRGAGGALAALAAER